MYGIFFKLMGYFTTLWNILQRLCKIQQDYGVVYKHIADSTNLWNILETYGVFYEDYGIFNNIMDVP